MITGVHFITYAHNAEKARAFFKDMLGLPSVDAGHGWLIFALPPAEIAAHPVEEPSPLGQEPRIEMYLMCDDVKKTVTDLTAKGVKFDDPIKEQPWGLLATLEVPGAGPIGLYQPRHPTAIGMK
jgi:predicted enzyme related to lactoylglutathione lyase